MKSLILFSASFISLSETLGTGVIEPPLSIASRLLSPHNESLGSK